MNKEEARVEIEKAVIATVESFTVNDGEQHGYTFDRPKFRRIIADILDSLSPAPRWAPGQHVFDKYGDEYKVEEANISFTTQGTRVSYLCERLTYEGRTDVDDDEKWDCHDELDLLPYQPTDEREGE